MFLQPLVEISLTKKHTQCPFEHNFNIFIFCIVFHDILALKCKLCFLNIDHSL